jgi:hypothetical protein
MTLMPDIDVLLPDEEIVRSRRDALVDELRRGARGVRPARTARRLALVLAALLTVAGGAAAAGVFSADDVKVQAGVGCYQRAALQADITIVGPVADPVAVCAALWREGVVDGRPVAEAPPLVACTGKDQPVRVLPGDGADTCSGLGLVPLPADYSQAAVRTNKGAGTAP